MKPDLLMIDIYIYIYKLKGDFNPVWVTPGQLHAQVTKQFKPQLYIGDTWSLHACMDSLWSGLKSATERFCNYQLNIEASVDF